MNVETYKGVDIQKIGGYFLFEIVNGRSIIQRVFLDIETAKNTIDKKIHLCQ